MNLNKYPVSVTAANVFLWANNKKVFEQEGFFSVCGKRGITSKPRVEKLKQWFELTKEVPVLSVATLKPAAGVDGGEGTVIPPV